jgi:hypothetical protein
MAINNDLGSIVPDYNTPEEIKAAKETLEWYHATDLLEILGM